jgi:hypothetical protein
MINLTSCIFFASLPSEDLHSFSVLLRHFSLAVSLLARSARWRGVDQFAAPTEGSSHAPASYFQT